jgi:hypothetical protein
MRDLAFYVLENDSGTPLAKQLLSLWRRSKFGRNPPRVESNIQSSETIIEEEQLEETSWEFLCT